MFDRPEVLAWLATHECPGTVCHTDAQTVHEAAHSLQSGATEFCWLQLWGLADLYEDRYTSPCVLTLHAVCSQLFCISACLHHQQADAGRNHSK